MRVHIRDDSMDDIGELISEIAGVARRLKWTATIVIAGVITVTVGVVVL